VAEGPSAAWNCHPFLVHVRLLVEHVLAFLVKASTSVNRYSHKYARYHALTGRRKSTTSPYTDLSLIIIFLPMGQRSNAI